MHLSYTRHICIYTIYTPHITPHIHTLMRPKYTICMTLNNLLIIGIWPRSPGRGMGGAGGQAAASESDPGGVRKREDGAERQLESFR